MRVIKAIKLSGECDTAPDTGGYKRRRELAELRKHLIHPAYQGALPLCREWIRPMGFEASILLAYIIEQNRHCLPNRITKDGYFELDENQIEIELCIDKTKFRNIIDKMRVHHMIKTRETTDEKGSLKILCRLNPPGVRATLRNIADSVDNKSEKGYEPFSNYQY
jgi:hypothetical protein